MIPHGATGRAFVLELARLFLAFEEATAMECVALKAAAVMPSLLLQRPSSRSKCKEFVAHLNRRLNLWKLGDIPALLDEGRCIQQHLQKTSWKNDDATIARSF